MTRVALVVGVIAAAAATPLAAARGGQDALASGSTFVVRGVVVQYIPPSGSVVGSLSIRIRSVGAHGRMLMGELVTVAVEPGSGLTSVQLVPHRSQCTVKLRAASPASILKGAATVQTIVPITSPSNGSSSDSAPANGRPADAGAAGAAGVGAPPSNGGDGGNGKQSGGDASPASGDHGSGQATDHGSGQSGDHGAAQSSPPAPAPQSGGGAGSSNGHK
jgi:hypothetical protein